MIVTKKKKKTRRVRTWPSTPTFIHMPPAQKRDRIAVTCSSSMALSRWSTFSNASTAVEWSWLSARTFTTMPQPPPTTLLGLVPPPPLQRVAVAALCRSTSFLALSHSFLAPSSLM